MLTMLLRFFTLLALVAAAASAPLAQTVMTQDQISVLYERSAGDPRAVPCCAALPDRGRRQRKTAWG